AKTPCGGDALWRGAPSDCRWLGEGFFATGLLSTADPATLRGKPFAQTLYTPMQYPFTPGVWDGPLIVLVDRNSYSATEEFAATLQDNRAAIILGEPTGGAGCGHTDGGTPETLRNSGATLRMPDCVRLRADGGNESRGVQPDILIGFTPRDGAALKGKRFAEKLDEAVALARRRP
ncbi:MAG TPA: S41 family peptidase, partial [Rhizomicrobium sp.]